MPRSLYQRTAQPGDDILAKLLGPLEIDIMELLWARGSATVRDITTAVQTDRVMAYTTIMTVMIHLAEKGLLRRIPLDKRTHLYEVALSREAFIQSASERVVRALVQDFGDLALAQFAEALEAAPPEQQVRVKHLRKAPIAPPTHIAESGDES